MKRHAAAVKEVQKKVNSRAGRVSFSSKEPSNTLRKRTKKGIDLTDFNRILEIHADWVLVEPRITFQELCRETMKMGLLPPVVPEFTSITVGGAVMGAALESSSHRFGQVSDICLEYEVVLGNGEVVRASAEENADLFYGLSGSYGTLGVLTSVKLKLIPAKKFVHITYHPLKIKEIFHFLKEEKEDDFVEAIALNKESGVAVTGNMSSVAKGPFFRQNHYWSPWYIQHIAEHKGGEEWMLTEEYLFRLDRGAFWMGQYILSVPAMLRLLLKIGIPKLSQHSLHPSFLFRLFFGWALSSRRLYQIWHNVPREVSENLFFVHDFYAPASKAEEIFDHFAAQTEIFPVWLCPIKGTKTPQLLSPHYGNKRCINIGLYGMPNTKQTTHELSARLEKEIADYGGRKMLYSYTYYDRPSFSKVYDDEQYNALRKKFFAEDAFPHIYNKVVI